MKLSDFDYKLPQGLIAQYPLKERDKSRMFVLHRKTGKTEHRYFYNLPEYLTNHDAVVLNDTKVLKARLVGNRIGFSGKIELLLLKEEEKNIFKCLAKPAKKLTIGAEIEFNDFKLKAQIVDIKDEFRFIKFNSNGNFYSILDKIGLMPLPPYIKRKPEPSDETAYQTIYAKKAGAIAAPTAGLHFTSSIIDKIKEKETGIVYITLHVGYGTFKPVGVENIEERKIYSEYFEISGKSAETINKTKSNNGRILAVGTTVCRALESSVGAPTLRRGECSRPTPHIRSGSLGEESRVCRGRGRSYEVKNAKGYTDLFIYPGYNFKMTDMLLTNFHLPRTTLLMLACAFAGYENIMKAYNEAIKEGYRFYSYGDCMLIV